MTASNGAGRVGVLALQGDVREHVRALAELGAAPVEVRTPANLAAVEAMVLPGGESTTMSLLLESSGLLEPLRGRLRDGMPVFGTVHIARRRNRWWRSAPASKCCRA